MAIDLNKSNEEKPKSRFNLSKSDEISAPSNDKIQTDPPKKKIDLSKPSQSNAQVPVSKESSQVNTPEKSKSNKTVILVILGIVCLVAIIWFFANAGKSPNLQEAITKKPISNDQVASDVSPSSSSVGDANPNLTDPAPSQTSGSPAIQPSQETPARSVNNEVQSTPKQETPVNVNIPYKRNESYQVYQFPFGASDYAQANPELDKLVEVLTQNPTMKISISAYTDDIGNEAYNIALSELRAKSIRDYLQNKGIDAARMKSQGMGISTKYTAKAENRRAEFVLSE